MVKSFLKMASLMVGCILSPAAFSAGESPALSSIETLLDGLKAEYNRQLDNNWIAFKRVSTQTLESQLKNESESLLLNEDEMYYGISECLLLWEGAYGIHILPKERHLLAESYAKRLNDWALKYKAETKISLIEYRSDKFSAFTAGYDIINSDCSLRIDLPNGLSIIADSHSTD